MWNVRVCVFQSWLYQFSRSEVCRGLNGSSQWKECVSDKDRRMFCGQTVAANKPSQRSRWWVILVAWQPATEVLAVSVISVGVPTWGIYNTSHNQCQRKLELRSMQPHVRLLHRWRKIWIVVVSIYIKCKYPNVLGKGGVLSFCPNVTYLVRFRYLPLKQWVVQFDNEKCYLLNYVLLMCPPTTTLNLPVQ